MVTVKDIALALGVSPSTVTRALADNPRISAKTRKRVKEKAAQLGYVADFAAKLMQGKESSLIGLLIPDIENSFYSAVAKGAAEVCNQNGFQLILAVSDDDPEIEERHIRELVSARCAGIMIVPTASPTAQSLTLLKTKKVAQLIRRVEAIGSHWHGIDDTEALYTATKYLIDLRHQRIGLICGDNSLSSGRERYLGYVSALKDAGLEPAPDLILRGPPRFDFGVRAALQLNVMADPPSAIIATGAGLAEGMLSAVATWDAGRRDVTSLIGYSESTAFRWWNGSGLTTIDLPVRQIATGLCESLLKRIRSKDDPGEAKVYGSHLLLRGSVHPL